MQSLPLCERQIEPESPQPPGQVPWNLLLPRTNDALSAPISSVPNTGTARLDNLENFHSKVSMRCGGVRHLQGFHRPVGRVIGMGRSTWNSQLPTPTTLDLPGRSTKVFACICSLLVLTSHIIRMSMDPISPGSPKPRKCPGCWKK